MPRDPLYEVIPTQSEWEVLSRRDEERDRWRVRFATRQDAVELADHLEYEREDSPIGKPDHYERIADLSGIPTYRQSKNF